MRRIKNDVAKAVRELTCQELEASRAATEGSNDYDMCRCGAVRISHKNDGRGGFKVTRCQQFTAKSMSAAA
jgi:hypothetical protein